MGRDRVKPFTISFSKNHVEYTSGEASDECNPADLCGKDRSTFQHYYEDIETEEAQETIKNDISYSEEIQMEDVEICKQVQKGLKSDAYPKGRFSVGVKKEFITSKAC